MSRKRLRSFAAVSMLLLTMGCGNGIGFYAPPAVTPATTVYTVYVTQYNSATGISNVLEFPANSQGRVAPATMVTGPWRTELNAVAVDTVGNLYVAVGLGPGAAAGSILVYDAGATETTASIRSITNPVMFTTIAVDETGQIYAANGTGFPNAIYVFATDASGNATPVRVISGNLTQINDPAAIAVDGAGNVYVSNIGGGNILVFSSTASGNVAPSRIIAGAATELGNSHGIAVDAAGDIFASTMSAGSGTLTGILEFAPGANGNVAPIKTLIEDSLGRITGIAVDRAGNVYLVTFNNLQLGVDVFSAGASGPAAPSQTITSTAWTSSNYMQIAVH